MSQPVSPALFDQFVRGWRGYVLVALIALTSAMFGAGRVPVMDVDEARFAQASRQMIESGDFRVMRMFGEVYFRKPPGMMWAIAASSWLFGHTELSARAVSASRKPVS